MVQENLSWNELQMRKIYIMRSTLINYLDYKFRIYLKIYIVNYTHHWFVKSAKNINLQEAKPFRFIFSSEAICNPNGCSLFGHNVIIFGPLVTDTLISASQPICTFDFVTSLPSLSAFVTSNLLNPQMVFYRKGNRML